MNLPNKISMMRIILALIVILLLTFPFHYIGINFPIYRIKFVMLDLRYIISGIIFIIACITDFIDGKIARKRHLVTDLGKFLDAIADKVLVNSVLVIFAANGMISPFIAVVIIARDTVVDAIRMMAASKGKVVAAGMSGKVKSAFMMVGLSLTFFKNLPFELMGFRISNFIIIMATVLSIYSMIRYYTLNKDLIFSKNVEVEVISD